MVTKVIVTHGNLGHELLKAAEMIVGDLPEFRSVTLDWQDSFEEASRKTRKVVDGLEPNEGVLILTDMYGGTPYNVAASLAEAGHVEVVTGVNLPMVVRLGCPDTEERTVSALAEWIQAKARRSICRAGEGNGSNGSNGEGSSGSCGG
jgi:PTS system mannose-specific IIA component